jgi:hypothetical protein
VGERSRGRFATPADIPLYDGSPYRGLHVRRRVSGLVPHLRTLCRAVPNVRLTFATFPLLYEQPRINALTRKSPFAGPDTTARNGPRYIEPKELEKSWKGSGSQGERIPTRSVSSPCSPHHYQQVARKTFDYTRPPTARAEVREQPRSPHARCRPLARRTTTSKWRATPSTRRGHPRPGLR